MQKTNVSFWMFEEQIKLVNHLSKQQANLLNICLSWVVNVERFKKQHQFKILVFWFPGKIHEKCVKNKVNINTISSNVTCCHHDIAEKLLNWC